MNLRDLNYLVTVVQTRHFGQAAARCHVSQPTLSAQIKKLEEELGVALFERTNRSVLPTPECERIVEHAREALREVEMIRELARAHRDPLAGELRLGAIPTLSPYLMPLVLMPLHDQHPQTQLILREEVTTTLLRRLRDNELDAVLVATEETDAELEEIPLFREPFWFVHPRNHPLYTQEDITRADLAAVELLLLSEDHCLTRQVQDLCGSRTLPGRLPDLRAAGLETLLQLVGTGLGCTLVPALAIRGPWMTDTGVIARQLAISDAYREVRLVFRRAFPRRRMLEAFVTVMLRHLPNTVRRLREEPSLQRNTESTIQQ